ncbi:E3 ubiquitin-protein ligase TRIM39-like [Ranitomeya imitator]|uniref:E3 ubiquitin-protein ligase TRIM39-like n=1 Tax=Ranitomeya imitator TaxID=111125 RepID=UPI0037E95372
MASAGLEKELNCSICLTLYKDPVTLRCGHNFCRACIDQTLNTQDESGVYSCPTCREEFRERPALEKNRTLCKEVENFLSIRGEKASILCTYCVDSPALAVRSCIHCEASLCDGHLKDHSKGPEHVLTDPCTSLQTKKCSVHKKILEYYCIDDATCICESCGLIGDHKEHNIDSLDDAFEKKMEKLKNVLQKLIAKRNKTERSVRNLEEQRRKAQDKTSRETRRVTALFVGIRRRVDELEKKVLSEISIQGEQTSHSLSDVIQNLEIKKDELSRKMRDIEELCNMTDPLTVLQHPDSSDLCDPEENKGGHDGDDGGAKLISHVSHTLSAVIRAVNVTYVQEPEIIALNVNTAHNILLVSDDLKTVTWSEINHNGPETAERFQEHPQVMSRRGFSSGRHYWDVEISKSRGWRVGMCYHSMDRWGHQSLIGSNNKSWGLYGGMFFGNQYSITHDRNEMLLHHYNSTDGVRICLDYEARQLSFYELCDPIKHLHTFTATFTEPLYAVFYLCEGSIKLLGRSNN